MTLASEAELDDLHERYLVLLNKHQLQREELSSNLSSGFFSIAKANFTASSFVRYGQDHYDDRMRATWRTNISARSIATRASDAVSVVHVQQRVRTSSEDLAQLAPIPSGDGVTAVEESSSSHDDRANDPLRWFGILVPPPLRAAQKSFAHTVCNLIPGLVNIELEMKTLEKQITLRKEQATKENGSV